LNPFVPFHLHQIRVPSLSILLITTPLPSSYPGRLAPPNATNSSQSESESLYDWQSVSLSVLVSSPVWGSWPDNYFDWKLQSCPYGAPSLTRGRVYHLSVTVDNSSPCQ
jgi:hypothetical protein